MFRRGKKQRDEIEAQFKAEVAALRRAAEEIEASDQLTEEESAIKLQAACEHDDKQVRVQDCRLARSFTRVLLTPFPLLVRSRSAVTQHCL